MTHFVDWTTPDGREWLRNCCVTDIYCDCDEFRWAGSVCGSSLRGTIPTRREDEIFAVDGETPDDIAVVSSALEALPQLLDKLDELEFTVHALHGECGHLRADKEELKEARDRLAEKLDELEERDATNLRIKTNLCKSQKSHLATIAQQAAEIERLKDENMEFRERLGLNAI